MQIFLNGESRSLDSSQTLADLVATLGYVGKRIAVERNGEIVPKSAYPLTALQNGDRLEIVVAVGGG